MCTTIQVQEVWWEPLSAYQKINMASMPQRALLGYMTKNGYLRDPVYGGAFKLLIEFEGAIGIPIITQKIKDDKVAGQIYEIANNAKLGKYDHFALSRSFIKKAKLILESEMRGEKRR